MPSAENTVLEFQSRVSKVTPQGWTAKWIDPPWVGEPPACRGCDANPFVSALATPGKKWSNTLLTRREASTRTLWWSCAQLCETCHQDQTVLGKVAIAIFAPLAPEVVS